MNKHLGSSFDEHMLKEHEEMVVELERLRAENARCLTEVGKWGRRVGELTHLLREAREELQKFMEGRASDFDTEELVPRIDVALGGGEKD